MHLHEQNHGVQQETDLRRPRPLQPEGDKDPERQPKDLVDALDRHAASAPAPDTSPWHLPDPAMQRQADGRAGDHEEVGNGQMPQLIGEQAPDLHAHGISRILHVAQHGGDAHDGEANPEEVEEAMEVTIIALGIEVGDARGELDGREDAAALFGTNLLARRGKRFCRRRSVFWDGS